MLILGKLNDQFKMENVIHAVLGTNRKVVEFNFVTRTPVHPTDLIFHLFFYLQTEYFKTCSEIGHSSSLNILGIILGKTNISNKR